MVSVNGNANLLAKIALVAKKSAGNIGIQMSDGFYVTAVDPDTNVSYADLEDGDIIVSFNSEQFSGPKDFRKWLRNKAPQKLTLTVYKKSDRYQKKTIVRPRFG